VTCPCGTKHEQEVWSGQRLATSPAPIFTHKPAMGYVKLKSGSYRAVTQVNVLSPEISHVSVVEAVKIVSGSSLNIVKAR
jgi:hypothetical protein